MLLTLVQKEHLPFHLALSALYWTQLVNLSRHLQELCCLLGTKFLLMNQVLCTRHYLIVQNKEDSPLRFVSLACIKWLLSKRFLIAFPINTNLDLHCCVRQMTIIKQLGQNNWQEVWGSFLVSSSHFSVIVKFVCKQNMNGGENVNQKIVFFSETSALKYSLGSKRNQL